jgi:glycosyltransferase involved in cell wall biosynthesis
MKISFYGSFLPDIGGISIHVSRMAELLKYEGLLGNIYSSSKLKYDDSSLFIVKNVSYSLLRYGFFKSFIWFLVFGFRNRSAIIHFHTNPIWDAVTLWFLTTVANRKIVCTLHDQMMLENIEKYPFLFRFTFKKLFSKKNIRWIAVNYIIKEQLEKLNSNRNEIYVIPAYIPVSYIPNHKDNEIENFILNKEKTIVIYAHSTALYEGKDLYGIDLAIKAMKEVKLQFPSIALIVCIPGEASVSQLECYKILIKDLNLNDEIFFNLKPLNNAIGLLQKSHILLRPTLTDGDSLMVREALSVGTFVIASDIVKRPEGVFLFESENLNNMVFKMTEVLGFVKVRSSLSSHQVDNNYLLIKEVYSSF